MSCDKIRINSDNVIRVEGVRNSLTAEYINDAVVELTLYDSSDVELAGQDWPLTLDYVTGSDGVYEGTLEDTIEAETGARGYYGTLTIDGGGIQGEWTLPAEFGMQTLIDLGWTTRRELEDVFGRANVAQWADLENDEDEDDIRDRVQWAIDEATADARDRLSSVVNVSEMTCVPRPLRMATTRLAGVLLYESRGVKDTADDGGVHRLSTHKKSAELYFAQLVAGQRTLDGMGDNSPAVTRDTPVETLDEFTEETLQFWT